MKGCYEGQLSCHGVKYFVVSSNETVGAITVVYQKHTKYVQLLLTYCEWKMNAIEMCNIAVNSVHPCLTEFIDSRPWYTLL